MPNITIKLDDLTAVALHYAAEKLDMTVDDLAAEWIVARIGTPCPECGAPRTATGEETFYDMGDATPKSSYQARVKIVSCANKRCDLYMNRWAQHGETERRVTPYPNVAEVLT